MSKYCFLIFGVIFLIFSYAASAESVKVFFNGKDCGALQRLSIGASTITLEAGDCTLPLDESVCVGEDSVCDDFELDTRVSGYYDGHIEPLRRHVYHFRSPKQEDLENQNRWFKFTVVDHGSEVTVNIGLSKVKGRVQPGEGESNACFTGPGSELSLSMATDSTYTRCLMEFNSEYYFTIESLDDNLRGDYRLSFHEAYY